MIDTAWAAEQGSSGMPQFQTEYFSSQLIWAIISFAILFYLLNRFVLPVVNRLLDERAEHIRQEIEIGEKLRQTGEKALKEHHLLLEQLQQDAQKVMYEVRKESLKCRDEAIAKINEEHSKHKQELFADIEFARQRALKELRTVSVDVAIAAAEKIMSNHIDPHETEKAVDEVIKALKKN
jgi:F-type H+-transporting ATPase subunit b